MGTPSAASCSFSFYKHRLVAKFVHYQKLIGVFIQQWHYEGGAPSRRSFCLFWHETKQMPELENFDAAWSEKGNAWGGSWKKKLRKGSWRRVTQRGSRQRTAEGTSQYVRRQTRWFRSPESTTVSSEEDKDESAFLVACRSFAKKKNARQR